MTMGRTNKIIAVVLFVIFAWLYYVTLDFPDVAAAYPQMLLILGMIFCFILFIQACLPHFKEKKSLIMQKKDSILLLLSMILMGVYLFAFNRLGYVVSTVLYMVTQMWMLKRTGKKWNMILIAIISIVILYGAFGVLLNVWLPKGILI
jgi:putative tricarboxylic transport membrane protein